MEGVFDSMKESAGQRSFWFFLLAVVCIIGLGFVLGFLWSILLVLLAVTIFKKARGGPADGFCMAHLRKKLWLVLVGLLLIVVGVGGIAYAWLSLQQTSVPWGDVAGGIVVALLGLLLGVYQTFSVLRDAFFPEKSALAASIRSQLDYPDEAPDVVELFSMVDQDIAENGVWFGPLAVGKEWVLGDEASSLARVRGIFYVDEVRSHHSSNGTKSTRILQLILLDDRRQTQTTDFSSPDDLQGAVLFLRECLPDAFYGKKAQMESLLSQTEEQWHQTESDFEQQRTERQKEQSDFTKLQNTILRRADNSVTSRITLELLRDTLEECENSTEEVFFLEATRPIPAGDTAYIELECTAGIALGTQVRLLLKEAPQTPGAAPTQGMQLFAQHEQALRVMTAWLQGQVPDLTQWTSVYLAGSRSKQRER